MRIPEDMLWPIKLLIQEKPHLFSRKTKKQFIRYWEKEIHWITGRRGKNYMIESAMSQGIKLNKKDIPTQNKQDKIILMFDFYSIENDLINNFKVCILNFTIVLFLFTFVFFG